MRTLLTADFDSTAFGLGDLLYQHASHLVHESGSHLPKAFRSQCRVAGFRLNANAES